MREQFYAKLELLIAEARRRRVSGFGEQEPEEATKQLLLEPLFEALGFAAPQGIVREFKIANDSVDYLLRGAGERPLLFVEAKSLHDCPRDSLFERHREQVCRYIQNYRLSPEVTRMEQPVTWILLTNFVQFHFIRVNEAAPTFVFTLDELWPRRAELWELLARENLEANRIDELYDQQLKADLDRRFLADLKRWRLLLANGLALRNPERPLEHYKLASQQLLDRFLFCRMLETRRLLEYNRLARAYHQYQGLYGRAAKTFAQVLRETLFLEIKNDFNTELFTQPLLCDELDLDNAAVAVVLGHEPLGPELAATCGFESGQAELLAFRHLYSYDFSRMSGDVMGAVYERFLAHELEQKNGRIVIVETNALRKKEGIYYTPKYIVDFVVEQTLGEKIRPILAEAKTLLGYGNYKDAHAKIRELAHLKVLDPAMGSGSFLLVAFDALVRAYTDYNAACRRIKKDRNGGGALFDADLLLPEEVLDPSWHVLTENLFGVDLDPQAVELAKLNLWLRYIEINRDAVLEQLRVGRARRRPLNLLPELTRNLKRGNSLIADPAVAGDAAFDWPKEFPEIMERGGFDVVLGNPPYERIQTLQAHAPQVVECLKKTYRAAASGNFDIYVCFIERGLQMLGPQGLLGFICPNKFFQAEYGRPLRTLLTEGRHVRQILSFGHEQVFPQASTYTCLLFLQRQPHDQPVYVKVDDLDAWRQSGQAASGRIASIGFGPQPWNFVLANGAELFEKLNQFPVRLRDVAERIAQGIRTSANPVYVLELRRADAKKVVAFSEQLQREVTLERKAVAFFLQGQNIRRYFLEPCRQVVVFPYRIRKGHAELIPETVLRRQFPLTHAYLRENKKILEAREDGRMRGQRWYAYVYPKNIELMHTPKILVPDIANFASFAHDENGQFAFTAGYGITLKADAGPSPAYVLGLLNSRLLDFYLKQVSTSLRGGYFRYFSQFIEQLPLKLIDRNNKREARLERDIIERVEKIQLAHRQKAALSATLSRLIAHRSRSPCNLAHYLGADFASALKPEILLDDVQRTGFVHAIQIEADTNGLLLSAKVAEQLDAPPRPMPVLRLGCRNEPLRWFLFAAWKQFLTEHARLKKWSKGRHPDSVYRLLVNTLEPLVCFSSDADENLRAIHDLMSAVEREAGTADLAAVEAEIERLDREIDARVYELYGLTPDEIALVEGRQQSRFQP